MRKIALGGLKGKGKFALVNDEDFEYLNQFHWSIDGSGYPQRAIKTEKGWRPIRMHRDILKLVGSEMADHKDLDRLNNQRDNIRKCNKADNNRNRDLLRNNSSGYTGVHYVNEKWRAKRWIATIHVDDRKIWIGRFLTKEEAARAYNSSALKHFGEFARLNLID